MPKLPSHLKFDDGFHNPGILLPDGIPESSQASRGFVLPWKILAFVTFTVAAVVALAVGLGVGLVHHPQSANMDPNNTSNESSSTIDGSVLPSILDGTSMAAASFQSGDKFLFYQAADGSIQFAAFSQSAKAWLSNSKLQLGPEFEQLAPKNGTPLSLVVLESWVYLLYVDTSNRIVQFGFTSDITESDGGTTNEPLPIPNAVMNPSSHSLSLTGALIGDYYHGLITFENDIGNISMWRTNQTVTGNGSSSDVIPFIDITNSLYAQLPPGASIAAPFVSALSQTANNTSPDEVAVDLAFLDPNATANSTLLLGTYYPNDHEVSLTPSPFGLSSSGMTPTPKNISAIQASDLVTISVAGLSFGLWINGTTPAYFSDYANEPPPPLPPGDWLYPRTATLINETGVVSTYLYRQVNGTAFEELFYETDISAWTAKTISIPSLANQTTPLS